jgi:hypothetical protein
MILAEEIVGNDPSAVFLLHRLSHVEHRRMDCASILWVTEQAERWGIVSVTWTNLMN